MNNGRFFGTEPFFLYHLINVTIWTAIAKDYDGAEPLSFILSPQY
jgi:hypothetical protein